MQSVPHRLTGHQGAAQLDDDKEGVRLPERQLQAAACRARANHIRQSSLQAYIRSSGIRSTIVISKYRYMHAEFQRLEVSLQQPNTTAPSFACTLVYSPLHPAASAMCSVLWPPSVPFSRTWLDHLLYCSAPRAPCAAADQLAAGDDGVLGDPRGEGYNVHTESRMTWVQYEYQYSDKPI